jgi:hypothetical protein
MPAPTIAVPTTTIVGGKRTTLELLSAEIDRVAAVLYDNTIDALIAAAVSGKWSIFTTIAEGQAGTPAGSVFAVFDTDADALAFYRQDMSSSVFLGAIEGADALAAAVQAAVDAKEAAEAARDDADAAVATLGAGLVNPQNALPVLLTTGSSDSCIITPPNPPDAYQVGMSFRLQVHVANTSGGISLNVAGLGFRPVYRWRGPGIEFDDLQSGDLREGDIVTVVYNGAAFVLAQTFPATTAEAQAGTGSGRMTASLTKAAITAQVPGVLNAGGAAPIFAARAWANFGWVDGAIVIRGSGNVASIVRLAIGVYLITFVDPLPDADWCAVCSAHGVQFNRQSTAFVPVTGYSAEAAIVWTGNTVNAAADDATHINFAAFR